MSISEYALNEDNSKTVELCGALAARLAAADLVADLNPEEDALFRLPQRRLRAALFSATAIAVYLSPLASAVKGLQAAGAEYHPALAEMAELIDGATHCIGAQVAQLLSALGAPPADAKDLVAMFCRELNELQARHNGAGSAQ